MNHELLDFGAKIAWPLVALVGIIILGPGRVLQNLIGELAKNLFQITDAVNAFKATANDFHKTQSDLKDSTQWVSNFEDRLVAISNRLESISSTTQQLAISEGSRSLERSVTEEGGSPDLSPVESRSVDEMYDEIRDRWEQLAAELKGRVGAEQFDARSIGQMAWKLVDGRRSKPLAAADAELIERLHSQMKRFNRLQSSRDEWLTYEIYSAFIRGTEQASAALS